MADEAGRYERVDNLRVADVTLNWMLRPNPLYRPRRVDKGTIYHIDDPENWKFNSVEEALAAVKASLD